MSELNKKILIDLAAEEMKHSLEIIRAKEAATVTKDDYNHKKKMIKEKLKQFYEDQDKSNITLKLLKLEQDTFGEPTKSLIGKVDYVSKTSNDISADMAKQMIEKLHQEKLEHKQILRERK